jgi:hypothetical protein
VSGPLNAVMWFGLAAVPRLNEVAKDWLLARWFRV